MESKPLQIESFRGIQIRIFHAVPDTFKKGSVGESEDVFAVR